MRRRISLYLVFALLSGGQIYFSAAAAAPAAGISARLYAALPQGEPLPVDIFRPAGCAPRGIMVVFAGYRRNSAAYRDDSKDVARALCLLVFAPHFSQSRFPLAQYQHGGAAGLAVIAPLLAWVGAQTDKRLPIILVGHSAGAQYLGRAIAYAPPAQPHFAPTIARSILGAPAFPTIVRVILISAGTYAAPVLTLAPPYGFQGKTRKALEAYLRAPITVLVGGDDVRPNAHLAQTPQAETLGANRLRRAQNFWASGKAQAARLKIAFSWDFRIIPAIGHSPRALLRSPILEQIMRQSLPSLPRH